MKGRRSGGGGNSIGTDVGVISALMGGLLWLTVSVRVSVNADRFMPAYSPLNDW